MKKGSISLIVTSVIIAIILFISVLVFISRTESVSSNRFCLDTYCTITVYTSSLFGGTSKAKAAMNSAWDAVTELENNISATLSYSEVYAVNSAAGTDIWTEVSKQTYDIMRFALEMGKATNGALNCALGSLISLWGIGTENAGVPDREETDRLLADCNTDNILLKEEDGKFFIKLTEKGTQINLGAVGKGWAADLAYSVLKSKGIRNAAIDFGGNLYVMGVKPVAFGSRAFRIGLRNPDDGRGGFFEAVSVKDLSVVTSGSYERCLVAEDGHVYSHILDPATGRSIENNVLSVSVIGKSSAVCDALSTAFFVLGPEGAQAVLKKEFGEYYAVFLLDGEDGRTVVRVGNSDILE
ncbi:MAG: FAD:protein FMN transferase [Sphaerochaeta sp.]